ncbi:MAG: peptidoglycan bridge formation glycyltransferase FemA/FemB family protein [Candidatus Microsaccharimonas sp.]
MLTIRRVEYSEFDTFSLDHPKGNFHQTSRMGVFREAMGWDVHPLFIVKNDKTVGAMILAGKAGRYEVTMGPLFDFETYSAKSLLTALKNYAKQIQATTMEIYPYELYQKRTSAGEPEGTASRKVINDFTNNGWRHKGFTTDYDVVANRWLFVKDLAGLKNEEELLASYRQTTRQTIKKLHSEDYSIKKMKYDDLRVVKKLVDSSYEKNHVAIRPIEYYQRLFKSFGDSIEFLVVYHKNKTPISTGVFIYHPNETLYFMSGADTNYRHLYGGHFLQQYVMSKAIEAGVTRYNFYGVSGHFTNNPLLVYKSGFRGYIEEYVGGFIKTINPTKALVGKARQIAGKVQRKIKV